MRPLVYRKLHHRLFHKRYRVRTVVLDNNVKRERVQLMFGRTVHWTLVKSIDSDSDDIVPPKHFS